MNYGLLSFNPNQIVICQLLIICGVYTLFGWRNYVYGNRDGNTFSDTEK